jgi:hypothetical protein
MTAPGTAVPANLTLVGGEMLGVAERDASAAGGPALAHLATTTLPPGARVLVAGPHDDTLLRALTAHGAQVTCLLRAYPDAEAVAVAHPGVRVLAGSLSKLPAAEPYDAVIAFDGCGRLCSVEGVQLRWQECLDVLDAALTPSGLLLLAVTNPLGLDRLVTLPDLGPAARTPDPTTPASAAEIADRLGLHLDVRAIHAGYPLPDTPTLLVAPEAPEPGTLSVLAAQACADGYAGRPVLTDPRTLAATAVRSGAVTTLAPVWIVTAARPDAPAVPAPATIVADRHGDGGFDVAYEVTSSGLRSVRRPAPAHRSGALDRDAEHLDGSVPTGRLLQEALISIASRDDAARLRRALAGYVAWLATLDDPVPAVPANVVVDGDAYTLLDPSWRWTASVPADAARARVLHLLATELVAGGFRHPWAASTGVGPLTVLLAAASGAPVDDAAVAAGLDLDADVRAATDGLDADDRDRLRADLATDRPASSRIDLEGYRELRAAGLRDREEIARLDELATAHERAITKILNSRSYKLSLQVVAAAQPVTSRVRRARRKMLGR